MLTKYFASMALLGCLTPALPQQIEIKMGTLAPEKSPWHEILQEIGQRWSKISGGTVRLTIFAGGTLGDEPDTVRKLRVNQLQAVALSGAGMGEIDKSVGCLQLPMMFDSYEELDYVRDRIAPKLEKRIEARGFLVLNWGDAGWVHFFSTKPAARLNDIRKLKLFCWAGDNEEFELWKANGFNPVSLPATDILMGLKTGLIEAVPTTPLYALWNQIVGLTQYMNDVKWAPLIGATVISKSTWEKIPQAFRVEMLKAARDSGAGLRDGIRKMGDSALDAMAQGSKGNRKLKLTIIHGDAAVIADWRREAEAVYPKLRGHSIDAELFDDVRRLTNEYRSRAESARPAGISVRAGTGDQRNGHK
jgi:TRAP-type C4-dicarboxylate transport system substrate-binding protein